MTLDVVRRRLRGLSSNALGTDVQRSSAGAIGGLAVGAGAIMVSSSGHATGTDPPVLALAGWVAGPLAAGVLAEFRPGHRFSRFLAGLGTVPAVALVLETARARGRPTPEELVTSPLIVAAAAAAILGAGYLHGGARSFRVAVVATVTWTAVGASVSAFGGPSAAGYLACVLAAALPLASTLLIVTTPPWMHLGIVRAVILMVLVATLAAAVLVAVVFIAATIDSPGPTGTGPAFAILLGLGLMPLLSWAYRALSVRLYGTSRQPGAALVGLYDHVPRTTEPSDLVAAAAAAVAGAVRSPSAQVVPPTDTAARGGRGRAVVPLVAGGERLGSLVVEPRRPGESFGRRDLTRLAQLSPAVAAIVQTAGLAQALEEAHRELGSLRETERRRLHHDLHDGMGPLLAGLAMQVASLRRAAERTSGSGESLHERIIEVADAVAQCQAETRRLVDGLAPEALDRMDLREALVDLAAGWSSSLAASGVRVDISCPSDLAPLPIAVRVAAYRIVAEAVTNVVRHARAQSCRIEAYMASGSLRLRVTDDGVGGDGHPPGVGLRSMVERANAAGGRFTLFPRDATVPPGQQGRGTVVEVTFAASEGQ